MTQQQSTQLGNRARRDTQGFSLIELMTVVLIVGIISVFAYPSYLNYSREARRAEGQALLLDVAAQQERFYYRNNSYTTTLADLGSYTSSIANSENGFYQISIDAADTTGFDLTATPQNDQTNDECGNLTMNETNKGGHSTGSTAECNW